MTKNIATFKHWKPPEFAHVPFRVARDAQTAVQMGLVVLETDLTIETELRYFIGDAVGTDIGYGQPSTILHSRIACDDQVTVENLTAMKERFAHALALFPTEYHFNVIGYGCTSASSLIGEDTVQAIVKSYADVDYVTTPLTGARRALKAVGAKNIGYLAPYISEISEKMCFLFEGDGFEVGAAATFGEGRDSIVGCIHPQSILDAIDVIISTASIPLDAIFISCTSLKCATVIAIAEAQHGIPVISSNSAIAWDMARLARLAVPANTKGLLFQQD